MANGDIRNFRLSNQCSAGNGMLLQAMANQFGVPVTEYADAAFQRRPLAEVQLRLRGVPRRRPRQFPERGLLQGGAAGRSGDGPAEERLAVRRADSAHGGARPPLRAPGRHAVQPGGGQGAGRLHQGARARTPRSTCIRTRARRARSARRSRLCASWPGAVARRSSGSTPRSISPIHDATTRRRVAISARTTARGPSSTRGRPTAAPAATSPVSAARKAPSNLSRRLKR